MSRFQPHDPATVRYVRDRCWMAVALSVGLALAMDLVDTWRYHGAVEAAGAGDEVSISAAAGLPNDSFVFGAGGAAVKDAAVTLDAAGTAGAALDNAGNNAELARSDHEHLIPWSAGLVFTATPTASTTDTKHMLANMECGSTNMDVNQLSVSCDTQGSGNLDVNIERFNAAGTTQGELRATDAAYSNTGDDRQNFATDQNDNNITNTDYFKVIWGTAVNGQDECTVVIQGHCRTI